MTPCSRAHSATVSPSASSSATRYLRASPNTAASLTYGLARSRFSTSEGLTFLPPAVIRMSFFRSTSLSEPPAVHMPTSPVASLPSRYSARVASGSRQYPPKNSAAVTRISPSASSSTAMFGATAPTSPGGGYGPRWPETSAPPVSVWPYASQRLTPHACQTAAPSPIQRVSADGHRRAVRGSLDPRALVEPDQQVRGELLEIARHCEDERRLDLVERVGEGVHRLRIVRDDVGDERHRDREIAAHRVAERQHCDGPVLARAQDRVVLDDVGARGQVRPVTVDRAFRVPGGPRRVDDRRGGVGRQRPHEALEDLGLPGERLAAAVLDLGQRPHARVAVHEERARVDHQHGAHVRALVQHLERLVEVLLVLGDDQRRAAVLEQMAHLARGARRIDPVGDRAERLRGEISDGPLRARIADDGHRLARRDAVLAR